uniref:EamA domain-containing protein n=1 Tax=Panagrolaimus sp. ES5 TaxID=591445 RepID=A0AC34FAQ4_9BILA
METDVNTLPLPTDPVAYDPAKNEVRLCYDVGSAESTRYLFSDLHFQRPFFTTYIKSLMFTLFLIKSCLKNDDEKSVTAADGSTNYSKLEEQTESEEESDGFEIESLTPAEFEPLHFTDDTESDRPPTPIRSKSISLFDEMDESDDGFGNFTEKDKYSPPPLSTAAEASSSNKSLAAKVRDKTRRVKFALFREVRRMPASIAFEARLARFSYNRTAGPCDNCSKSPFLTYLFLFAPLWFLSSTTYQGALVFDDVSFVTLISSSSSLFILIFGALNPQKNSDRFSYLKLFLVLMNLCGVGFISELSGTTWGLILSISSAFCYAAFLHSFSTISSTRGKVDRALMFGSMGLFSIFACTPVILIAHYTGIERQIPLPTQQQMAFVVLTGLIGSIFADYLWIWATELTSPLISSLSLTLSIPLSFVADSLLRGTTPTFAQIISSFPIMISFIGASLIQNTNGKTKTKVKIRKSGGGTESANLITNNEAEEQL